MTSKYMVSGSGKEKSFTSKSDAKEYIKHQLHNHNMQTASLSMYEDGRYHLMERYKFVNGVLTKSIPQ